MDKLSDALSSIANPRIQLILLCRYDPEVKHKPRKLPDGLFSWMAPTLLYPEDEILTVAGMDTVVMSRLLMYGEFQEWECREESR
jgi:hypothetical protein